MFKKITICLLVATCLIQANLALEDDSNIQKVIKVEKEITAAIVEGAKEIHNVRKNLTEELFAVERCLGKKITKVANDLHNAIVDARKAGKNVRPCLTHLAEEIALLNLGSIVRCHRYEAGFINAGSDLGEMGRLKGHVAFIIPKCQGEDDLDKCVDSALDDAVNRVHDLSADIRKTVDNVLEQTHTCVVENRAKVSQRLDKLETDTKTCLAKDDKEYLY